MSLHNLTEVQEEKSSFKQQREQKAQLHYHKGVKLLARATRKGFNDPVLLQQSFDVLMNSITQNRYNPEPYIAIGYILILLQDNESAKTYIDAALALEPEHPDALKFMALIVQQSISGQTQNTFISFDELYDQTELMIIEQVKTVTAVRPPQVVYNSDSLEKTLEKYDQLVKAHDFLQERLDKLEEEFDISPLLQRFKPVKTMLYRYRQAIRDSRPMVDVIAQIQQVGKEVKDLVLLWRNRPELIHAPTVEGIYDRCDNLANQLDASESQGVNIKPAEKQYEYLLLIVGELQEVLEDNLPPDF